MKPLKLGITGCIGSGKSLISKILQGKGIPVYDCDSNAKALMESNSEIRNTLTALFGQACYPDGKHLDRKYLAGCIFGDSNALQKVNNIVHPKVREDFANWCTTRQAPIVAMESAILFESGFDGDVDIIITVKADRETCIERACRHSNATRSEVTKRLDKQNATILQEERSHFVILNDNRTAVLPQIEKMILRLRSIISTNG